MKKFVHLFRLFALLSIILMAISFVMYFLNVDLINPSYLIIPLFFVFAVVLLLHGLFGFQLLNQLTKNENLGEKIVMLLIFGFFVFFSIWFSSNILLYGYDYLFELPSSFFDVTTLGRKITSSVFTKYALFISSILIVINLSFKNKTFFVKHL